tara:strand:- start:2080 stop:2937 length:858 start_codon:yes stop_codon:yes gene_type:complete
MKIITHPGQAHRDEALAIGLILAEKDPATVQVLRRNPTPAEMDDPDVWVVDVGEQHHPELHNFDHHQIPADAPPTCAMTLVAEYFGISEQLSTLAWYDAVAVLDSKGPKALAKLFEVDALHPGMISPFELPTLRALEKFSGDTPVHPFLCRVLRFVAEDHIAWSKTLHEAREKMDNCSQVLRVGGLPTLVHLMVANPTVSSKMREEWMEAHDEVIGMSLSHDDRGDGWCLFRFDDHPGVDFDRLRGRDDMEFVHASGFVGKTKELLPLPDLLNLAAIAVSPLDHP